MTQAFLSVYSTAPNVPSKAYVEVVAQVAGDVNTTLTIGLVPDQITPALSGFSLDQGGNLHPSGTGIPFSSDDDIRIAYDQSSGNMWIAVNDDWIGGGDPATGSSPTFTGLSGPYYVVATIGSLNHYAVCLIRTAFDQQSYNPPTGFMTFSGL